MRDWIFAHNEWLEKVDTMTASDPVANFAGGWSAAVAETEAKYLPLVQAYKGLKNKTNPHDFLDMFMRQADEALEKLKGE